jgi:uncharacterized protein involved in exopolysaccharide biosynthesis
MNQSEISISKLLNEFFTDYKFILKLTFLSLLLSTVLYVILPKKYVAEMSITQSSSSSLSSGLGNVSNIASSFGINLNNLEGDIFYLPNLIESNTLKQSLLSKDRVLKNDLTNLIDYYNQTFFGLIKNIRCTKKCEDKRLYYAIERFSNDLKILEDQNSGMITVQFISYNDSLSKEILSDIIDYLNEYLNSDVNLQATSMLKLINSEIENTKDELNSAEDEIATFVDENRTYFESPSLIVQYSRLERDVTILTEKYMNLIVQQTMSLIEEKKQLPQLNIISSPLSDPSTHSPKILNIFFIVFLLVFSISLAKAGYKVSTKS